MAAPSSARPNLQLRSLDSTDLDRAVQLDRDTLGGMWTLEGYQRELMSPCSDLIGLFACPSDPNGSPPTQPATHPIGLGCQWAILDEAHITLLAVHPDVQGHGFGRLLLWSLMVHAHRRGLARATLEVRVSNTIARSLYEKFGFHQAGLRKRYYAATGEDAAILWRSGLDHPHFGETLHHWETAARDRIHAAGWPWPAPVIPKAISPIHALD